MVDHPSLESLDKNDDLIYTTDFRSLYKSIVQDWFHVTSLHFQFFSPIPLLKFNVKRNYISNMKSKKKVSSKKTKNSQPSSIINYLLR